MVQHFWVVADTPASKSLKEHLKHTGSTLASELQGVFPDAAALNGLVIRTERIIAGLPGSDEGGISGSSTSYPALFTTITSTLVSLDEGSISGKEFGIPEGYKPMGVSNEGGNEVPTVAAPTFRIRRGGFMTNAPGSPGHVVPP